jgi:Flp pilus assembly protein TadG
MTHVCWKILRQDRRGVATVEFALWSVLILGALLPCLDFALYLVQAQRLSAAVGQASILAYNMRNASAVNVSQLTGYMIAGSGLPAGTVAATVTCNVCIR